MLDPGPPIAQLILPVQLPVASKSDRMPVQLLIARPVTDAATGTDRIMALMNGYEVRALDAAKWVSPVPVMVQRLLIDSLEATRSLEAVGWEDSGMDTSFRLTTDVRRFYLRYESADKPPVADLVLVLGLTDTESGKVLARKLIAVEQPCTENSTREFVAAFSLGMGKVLAQSNEWVVDNIAKALGK
ncbi:ABC-type transport auxiliary lipoprotein family protein [Desulfovibrio sp. OttesenSCG-928-O18]|nr:ABC-type transport auxiliary lipoprotein family protein [Desulfovibrio sp. OttesenSCG-928-O18]